MSKYLPTYVYQSIYDIDFSKLYATGKRIIIADLDNTLMPYTTDVASPSLVEWQETLKNNGFKLYLVSNNNDHRIKKVMKTLKIDGYLAKAGKPKKDKVKAFLEDLGYNLDEVILLGDQLVTDIACAGNLGIASILVKTIDYKTQKWYTKINRLREKRIIKKLKQENLEIAVAIEKLSKEN